MGRLLLLGDPAMTNCELPRPDRRVRGSAAIEGRRSLETHFPASRQCWRGRTHRQATMAVAFGDSWRSSPFPRRGRGLDFRRSQPPCGIARRRSPKRPGPPGPAAATAPRGELEAARIFPTGPRFHGRRRSRHASGSERRVGSGRRARAGGAADEPQPRPARRLGEIHGAIPPCPAVGSSWYCRKISPRCSRGTHVFHCVLAGFSLKSRLCSMCLVKRLSRMRYSGFAVGSSRTRRYIRLYQRHRTVCAALTSGCRERASATRLTSSPAGDRPLGWGY